MEPILIVVLVAVLIPVIWWIAVFNRITNLKNTTEESWSDIDVELKRRYDLIPNLVETVKGYAKHEQETLERVVARRDVAMGNRGSAESQGRDESQLGLAMKTLFAVAEGYPELKSDANFRVLQEELAITEDRIAAALRCLAWALVRRRGLRIVGDRAPRPHFRLCFTQGRICGNKRHANGTIEVTF